MDEERFEEEPSPEETPVQNDFSVNTPLSPEEYRLLQCLLYGRELSWVRSTGQLLSVLVDGINDKLYDTFLDAVVDSADPPTVIEDYSDDLKEMIMP